MAARFLPVSVHKLPYFHRDAVQPCCFTACSSISFSSSCVSRLLMASTSAACASSEPGSVSKDVWILSWCAVIIPTIPFDLFSYIGGLDMFPLSSSTPAPSVVPVPSVYHWPPYQWPSASHQPYHPYPPSTPYNQNQPSVTFHNTTAASYGQQTSHSTPAAFRIALGDSTTSVVNQPVPVPATPAPGTTSRAKRARKATEGGSEANPNKRRNTSNPDLEASASSESPSTSPPVVIPGIGPVATSVQDVTGLHPALDRLHNSSGSLLKRETVSLKNASDVWYFVRGQNTKNDEPLPTNEKISTDRPPMIRPGKVGGYAFLRCRLCKNTLTIWQNNEGQNKTIRRHLQKAHERQWKHTVIVRKLKDWQKISLRDEGSSERVGGPGKSREPFTVEGFCRRLVRWFVVDDQSVDTVDSPELRDLFLYLNSTLSDSDIPHRTKLAQLIVENFSKEYKTMVDEISTSLGRVAFTSDIWSRHNMQSYMAVTAHYLVRASNGKLTLRSRLVAFRAMQGSHTGVNIGKAFIRVLKEIRCLHKVSNITLDNASNNDTAMEQIKRELDALNIPFDAVGNRIRCFPHIVNLAVKAGLFRLTELSVLDDELDEDLQALVENPAYAFLLQGDHVKRGRQLVAFIRDSGLRREDFEEVIRKGNKDGSWGKNSEGTPVQLRVVGLLKDVDTRWSSTFLMIDRVVELRLAIEAFFKLDKYRNFSDQYCMSEEQFAVLNDIRQFLGLFHLVQELVSAEKTPTLSFVLPMYEKLLTMLENLKVLLPEIASAITSSQTKLRVYLEKARNLPAYTMSIVINPELKYTWMKDHWSHTDYKNARDQIFDSLLRYRTHMRKAGQLGTATTATTNIPSRPTANASGALKATFNAASGMDRLNNLARTLSESAIAANATPTTAQSSDTAPDSETAAAEALESDEEADRKAVEEEITKYEADGTERTFDLLQFWTDNAARYPLFFRLALDVLPIQASAVPCERAFSSSKETDALRRSSMSPLMMEILQILKFIYREDRLTFTDALLSTPFEGAILDVDPYEIDILMAEGKIDELCELIDKAWEGWGETEAPNSPQECDIEISSDESGED